MITNKKNIRFIPIGLSIVLILCLFFAFNSQSASAAEKVRINLEKIDESIQNEINNRTILSLSSNPYDYVVDNQYYDKIILLGVAALPELETTLINSENNGLNEYILAIAIEEISKVDVNKILGNTDYGWENAMEFESEWTKIKSTASHAVETIILSNELDTEEKIMQISNYGILAIPSLESYLSAVDSREKSSLDTELEKLVGSYRLSKNDISIIDDFVN